MYSSLIRAFFGIYPTFPLLILPLWDALEETFCPPSSVYSPPAKKVMNAPKRVPGESLFPKSQILKSRLISFLTFRTIVTVNADAAEARRLTPRMQAYWVRTFITRKASWLGICILAKPF